MRAEINEYLKDRQIEMVGEYIALREPTDFKCHQCGHAWLARPLIVEGLQCPECVLAAERDKLTSEKNTKKRAKTCRRSAYSSDISRRTEQRIRERAERLGYELLEEYVSFGKTILTRCNRGHTIKIRGRGFNFPVPCTTCRALIRAQVKACNKKNAPD